MDPGERAWLLDHLRVQADTLTTLVGRAGEPLTDAALAHVRDQLFVMQETLDTLGVAAALASHAEWQRAIGTDATADG